MTDHLTRMLHDAGSEVDPGFPPAAAVLTDGRRRRRRRTTGLVGATTVAVALVLTGALLVPGGSDRAVDPVTPPDAPTFEGVTYAIGNEVFLDGGESSVTVEDRAVKSLYYSSAGVVVRHGENSSSDGGGPQQFTLVREDGTTSPISVETDENAHGVDPAQPYLAWTEVVPGGVEVVVHDVETDIEAARVEVDGSFDWSPPPVALDGDTVYVGGTSERGTLLAVDWRSGAVADSGLRSYVPEVTGDRTVAYELPRILVRDTGGDEVLEIEGFDTVRLAPGGGYAVATTFDVRTAETEVAVFDLATGDETALSTRRTGSGLVGWSLNGQLVAVDGETLTVCSPVTGECETREDARLADAVDRDGNVEIQLGGVTYES